jgi:hypothetical protein
MKSGISNTTKMILAMPIAYPGFIWINEPIPGHLGTPFPLLHKTTNENPYDFQTQYMKSGISNAMKRIPATPIAWVSNRCCFYAHINHISPKEHL